MEYRESASTRVGLQKVTEHRRCAILPCKGANEPLTSMLLYPSKPPKRSSPTVKHSPKCCLRCSKSLPAARRDCIEPFCPAASLDCRVTHPRNEQIFFLQPLQSRIERPGGHASSDSLADFFTNADAVGSDSESQDRKNHDLLEFSKRLTTHDYNVVHMLEKLQATELVRQWVLASQSHERVDALAQTEHIEAGGTEILDG